MGSIVFRNLPETGTHALAVDLPRWMQHKTAVFILALLAAAFSGCAPDLDQDNPELGPDGQPLRPIALFDLQDQQKLPWPNAVVQTSLDDQGNLVIGPLNLPNPDNNPLLAQVNQLSGFTQLPVITFDFSRPISEASIRVGENLIIAGVDPTGQAEPDLITPGEVEVAFDEEYNKLRIYPQRPLRPSNQYVVVLTKSVEGVDGRPIQEDLFYRFTKYEQPLFDPATGRVQSDLLALSGVGPEEAAQLEQLRLIYQQNIYSNAALNAFVAADLGGSPSDEEVIEHYAVAAAFITAGYPGGDPTAQMDTLVQAVLDSGAGSVITEATQTLPANVFFNPDLNPSAPAVPNDNIGFVSFTFINTLDFRDETGAWPDEPGAGNPATAQVLAIYPAAVTLQPVPVVIFQHGLGSCKNQAMFAVADSFASQNIAIVGIDIIEHGTRAVTNVDPDNDEGELGPCDQPAVNGGVARSGEGFIRIDNLALTRDAIRQSVLDQVALMKAVNSGNYAAVNTGSTDFVPGSATFAGVSLGAMLGGIFLAEQEQVNLGVLNAPGAWLSRLFTESPTFGPELLGTLAEQMNMGPVTGETFQDFLTKLVPLVQGLVDPADPAYYMHSALDGGLISENNSILIQEAIDDPVIPNFSTAYMAQTGGVPLIEETTTQAFPFPAYTRFDNASHSTLLTPDDPTVEGPDQELLATTTAMRTQLLTYIGSFLQSMGNAIQVLITE